MTDTPVLSDLESIRERNEEERRGLALYPHRYCEDAWYACPMHPEYQGRESPTPENCDCDHDDRAQRIADVDALLRQVDQLTRERDEARRRFDQREWYVKDMEGTLDDIRDAFDMKGRDPDAMIARAKASRPFDVEKVQAIADAAIHAEDHIGMSMFANEEEWRGARRYEVARVISEELHRLIGGKS